jgi:hypothetical protein
MHEASMTENAGTLIENVPSFPAVVPIVVPFATKKVPGKGAPVAASITFPVIVIRCAVAVRESKDKNSVAPIALNNEVMVVLLLRVFTKIPRGPVYSNSI